MPVRCLPNTALTNGRAPPGGCHVGAGPGLIEKHQSARDGARLLGSPTVAYADVAVRIPRRQARALIYRLAAELRPVPRIGLVVWPAYQLKLETTGGAS